MVILSRKVCFSKVGEWVLFQIAIFGLQEVREFFKFHLPRWWYSFLPNVLRFWGWRSSFSIFGQEGRKVLCVSSAFLSPAEVWRPPVAENFGGFYADFSRSPPSLHSPQRIFSRSGKVAKPFNTSTFTQKIKKSKSEVWLGRRIYNGVVERTRTVDLLGHNQAL